MSDDGVLHILEERIKGIIASIKDKRERLMFSRPPSRLRHTRGQNGTGLVTVATCPICGREYRVHRGWPNQQCGRHLKMRRSRT